MPNNVAASAIEVHPFHDAGSPMTGAERMAANPYRPWPARITSMSKGWHMTALAACTSRALSLSAKSSGSRQRGTRWRRRRFPSARLVMRER